MNGRSIARILLVVILVGAAIGLGVGAYNAGVSAGLAQSGNVVVTPGAYPVAPYVGYGWGWGFGPGFGFFGFIGGLLFLFIFIGIVRAAFGGMRGGWGPRHGPWTGPGGYRGNDFRGSPWEDRAREIHDAWHRDHPEAPDRPAGGSTSSGGSAS
jgi:hypothetical protein